METSFVVFLIGSAVSFLPTYWILCRAFEVAQQLARREPQTENSGTTDNADKADGRQEFMKSLRHEALSRVDAALGDVARDVRRMTEDRTFSSTTLSKDKIDQLDEARKLVGQLFTAQDLARFDQIISAILAASPGRVSTMEKRIDEFRSRLAEIQVEAKPRLPFRDWFRGGFRQQAPALAYS